MKNRVLGSISLLISMSAFASQLHAHSKDDIGSSNLSLSYEEESWYNKLNVTIEGGTITKKKTSWEMLPPSHPAAPAELGARTTETCVGEMDAESVQRLQSVIAGLNSGDFETVYGHPLSRHSSSYKLKWQQGADAQGKTAVYTTPSDRVPEELNSYFEDVQSLADIARQCTTSKN